MDASKKCGLQRDLILPTKLYIPSCPVELVPRSDLTERLNAGIHKQLTLISAPIGYGKTTLLSEWASQCGQKVAWVSLEPDDNAPIRFWKYFIGALRTIEEHVGENARSLFGTFPTPPLKSILTDLIYEVISIPHAFSLVLDNYHRINCDAIHEGLGSILEGVDWACAMQTSESVIPAMIQRGECEALQSWLEALPEELLQSHPQICFWYAWTLLWSGEIEAVEPCLQLAEQGWRDKLGDILNLRALVAGFRGEGADAFEFAQKALNHFSADERQECGATLLALGIGHYAMGNVSKAFEVLNEAHSTNQAEENSFFTLVGTYTLGNVMSLQGKLRQAFGMYTEVLRGLDEQPYLRWIGTHLQMGNLHYEWNKLDPAENYLRQALESLPKAQSRVDWPTVRVALARVMWAKKDEKQAFIELNRAFESAQQFGSPYELYQVKAHRVRLYLMQGDMVPVNRWFKERHPNVADSPTYLREVEQLTLARIFIHQGQPEEAINLLTGVYRPTEASGRTASLIEIYALKALAYHVQGTEECALDSLEHALSIAEPEGYVRLFVDEGEPMLDLLIAFLKKMEREEFQTVSIAYVGKLLTSFGAERVPFCSDKPEDGSADKLLPAGTESTLWAYLVDPLSKRELEVLQLGAEGLSNREIAKRLYLSVSTIKRHMHNIYRKLRVNRRGQAVARARELNLLTD